MAHEEWSGWDGGLCTFFEDIVQKLHVLELGGVGEFATGVAGGATAFIAELLLNLRMAS